MLTPQTAVQIEHQAELLRPKTMLCIFWDQEEPIYYELLKPGETCYTDRYKQQLLNLNDAILEKREQYKKQQHKVIFLHDNAPSNRAKPTKDVVKALGWEPLAHVAYSPDLSPSDYHLFASLGHALAENSASLLTKTSNLGLMTGWPQKTEHIFWRGIHKLSERLGKCVASDGYNFE
ncbi:mariner Mos1 transposase [Trichonephila clavipes]|nr:mariner Mos1 transposase [Trichonephila clavipes]